MTQQLIDALSVYLGELLHERDNTFDWIEKEKLIHKINAVYVLLGIDKKEKTFLEIVREIINDK